MEKSVRKQKKGKAQNVLGEKQKKNIMVYEFENKKIITIND